MRFLCTGPVSDPVGLVEKPQGDSGFTTILSATITAVLIVMVIAAVFYFYGKAFLAENILQKRLKSLNRFELLKKLHICKVRGSLVVRAKV